MELHVFPIPIPPPTSLSTRFLFITLCCCVGVLVDTKQQEATVTCLEIGTQKLKVSTFVNNIRVHLQNSTGSMLKLIQIIRECSKGAR